MTSTAAGARPVLSRRSASASFDERYWISTPLNLDLKEARTGTHDKYSIELPAPNTGVSPHSSDRASEALFRYDIFPPKRMRAHVCTPDRRISLGATIIQRVLIGPIAMEMGVRVVEVVSGNSFDRVGFTYATLEGHSERGIATFSVRRLPSGQRVFEIETWSTPGNLLARLGRPVARLVQRTFTRDALSYFRGRCERQTA